MGKIIPLRSIALDRTWQMKQMHLGQGGTGEAGNEGKQGRRRKRGQFLVSSLDWRHTLLHLCFGKIILAALDHYTAPRPGQ